MMRHAERHNTDFAGALSEDEDLRGITIDGYEVAFTTKVALMPVDLVAAPRSEEKREVHGK